MDLTRRTVVRFGMAGTALGAVAFAGAGARAATAQERQAVPSVVPASQDPVAVEQPEPPLRYLFKAKAYNDQTFGEFSSLQEVWAQPDYLRYKSVDVRYVGPQPQVLTDQENKGVDAAVAAGAQGARQQICMKIMAASTRIDQRAAIRGFNDQGRAIIVGALALAPTAPQAAEMRRWIAAGAPSA